VVLGVASVVANSISTGVSEYLSSKAHRAFIQAEKRRELWEFKNYRDAEISEVSVALCDCVAGCCCMKHVHYLSAFRMNFCRERSLSWLTVPFFCFFALHRW